MTPGKPLMWSLVIPVKALARAKSRLAGVTAADRAAIVLAMAADTTQAALACPAVSTVIVVSDDREVRIALESLGVIVLPDRPAAGLNAALAYGAEHAVALHPRDGRAALTADLPALKAAELTGALAVASAAGQAFVADAAGSGTTLYAAAPWVPFAPCFGPMSRARHRLAGVAEVDLTAATGLRQDVDTLADLRAAAGIGLGRRTAGLLGRAAAAVRPGQPPAG